ncbi:MAG: ABC transporter substrate-binding protein [Acidobacteriota bacterium]|nr:ABC transporter substrate-binding protein [Acidobacteriota bacterium]
MRKHRRVPSAVPLVLGVALALSPAGCGGGGAERTGGSAAAGATATGAPGEPARGGTVTVVVGHDVRTFIDWFAVSTIDLEMTGQVFRPLAEHDAATDELVPALAESWSLEDGGRVIEFTLRDDAAWEDGTPVTSRDVAFTHRMQTDAEVDWVRRGDKRRIARVETPDDRTARFVLDAPYVDGLYDAALGFIYPAHLLEGMSPAELAGSEFAKRPVGCGPFRLSQRQTDIGLEFTASDTYYGGRSHLDRLVVRVNADPKTRAILFEQGDVDLLRMAGTEEFDRMAGDERFRGFEVPYRTFLYVTWNVEQPELAEARVRRALAMALDRERMRGLVLKGHGALCDGPVAPGSWAYVAGLPVPAFDPDAASALLDEAGWKDGDADGVREKDGRPLSFTLAFAGRGGVFQDTATLIRTQLESIGVEVKAQRREPAVFFDELDEGRFHAVLLNETQADKVDLAAYGHSREIGGGTNTARWFHPEFDRACDEAGRAATREQALPRWRRAQEVMAEGQPYTFLYYRPRMHLVSARVRGVEIGPRGLFANVSDWWISLEERRR